MASTYAIIYARRGAYDWNGKRLEGRVLGMEFLLEELRKQKYRQFWDASIEGEATLAATYK